MPFSRRGLGGILPANKLARLTSLKIAWSHAFSLVSLSVHRSINSIPLSFARM